MTAPSGAKLPIVLPSAIALSFAAALLLRQITVLRRALRAEPLR